MKPSGVPVVDLYSAAANHPEYYEADGFGINMDTGGKALGALTADAIKKAIDEKNRKE